MTISSSVMLILLSCSDPVPILFRLPLLLVQLVDFGVKGCDRNFFRIQLTLDSLLVWLEFVKLGLKSGKLLRLFFQDFYPPGLLLWEVLDFLNLLLVFFDYFFPAFGLDLVFAVLASMGLNLHVALLFGEKTTGYVFFHLLDLLE